MASRQRRGRSRQSNSYGSSTSGGNATKMTIFSRRTLLLSLFVITTAIFFSFQISRYKNEHSVTGRLISSVLNPNSRNGIARLKPSVTDRRKGGDSVIELQDRISALANQFKMEFGAIVADKSVSTEKQEAGMAVIAGEEVVDHSIPSLLSTEHSPEKSTEEAAKDQQIGLQDLDEDTLRAMLNALYARD